MSVGKRLARIIVLTAVAALLVIGVTVQAAKNETAFHEKKIVLKFGLMSDLHFDAVNTYTENYQNNTQILQTAVRFLKETLSEDDLRGIVIGGDVNNWNAIADLRMAKEAFDGCLDPAKTELIPTVGNHDAWCANGMEPKTDPLSGKRVFVEYNLYKETLGDYVYWDTEHTASVDLNMGYYHTVMNGMHFLSVVGVDSDHGVGALAWMVQELEAIRASEDRGKPVFIVTHCPPRNTAVGTASATSQRWTSDTIADKLGDYPEAILLTGHTHATANDDGVLWQEDSFSVLHSGCLGEGEHSFATMEVDNRGHIRYTGYHVVPDTQSSSGWTVKPFEGRQFVFSANPIPGDRQPSDSIPAAVCGAVGALAVIAGAGTAILLKARKKKVNTSDRSEETVL